MLGAVCGQQNTKISFGTAECIPLYNIRMVVHKGTEKKNSLPDPRNIFNIILLCTAHNIRITTGV